MANSSPNIMLQRRRASYFWTKKYNWALLCFFVLGIRMESACKIRLKELHNSFLSGLLNQRQTENQNNALPESTKRHFHSNHKDAYCKASKAFPLCSKRQGDSREQFCSSTWWKELKWRWGGGEEPSAESSGELRRLTAGHQHHPLWGFLGCTSGNNLVEII